MINGFMVIVGISVLCNAIALWNVIGKFESIKRELNFEIDKKFKYQERRLNQLVELIVSRIDAEKIRHTLSTTSITELKSIATLLNMDAIK